MPVNYKDPTQDEEDAQTQTSSNFLIPSKSILL
jgi:hypothetical protein